MPPAVFTGGDPLPPAVFTGGDPLPRRRYLQAAVFKGGDPLPPAVFTGGDPLPPAGDPSRPPYNPGRIRIPTRKGLV